MSRLLSCVALAGIAAATAQEEDLYRPLPLAEWKDPAPGTAREVVVVAARFERSTRVCGNGLVVRGGSAKEPAWVLTCAHLVQKKNVVAREVRVGAFAHSLVRPPEGAADYREGVATVVSADIGLDLALVSVPLELRAWRDGTCLPGLGQTVASVVPFGRPVAETAFHVHVKQGQSGSPVFEGSGLTGLVLGKLGGSLEVLARRKDLERFLGGVEGGAAIVEGWRRDVKTLEQVMDEMKER